MYYYGVFIISISKQYIYIVISTYITYSICVYKLCKCYNDLSNDLNGGTLQTL